MNASSTFPAPPLGGDPPRQPRPAAARRTSSRPRIAAARAGTLPEDLKEEAVLKRLPVLFRTLRGKKVSEDQLDRLVDRLRRK
jgi:hypothetical protein